MHPPSSRFSARHFRGQFVAGPSRASVPPDWPMQAWGEGLHVAAHPDLDMTCAAGDRGSLLLLGYILDPRHPADNNAEVIERILDHADSTGDILESISGCAGRYVLLIRFDNAQLAVHDAAGTRQLYHHVSRDHGVWLASQPTWIAHHLEEQPDPTVEDDLLQCTLFAHTPEHWYPGRLTAFSGVHHLVPNHCLDLVTGEVRRTWPTQPVRPRDIRAAVDHAAPLLTGILESAAHRFDLAMGISAGLDSRIVLAAALRAGAPVHYVTQVPQPPPESMPDADIPSAMLARLGQTHHRIPLDGSIDTAFADALRDSVYRARLCKGQNAWSVADHFERRGGAPPVVLYGNLGEISRRDRSRFPHIPTGRVDGAFLRDTALMFGSRMAAQEFGAWRDEVRHAEELGYHPLTLFHWEQRVGGWAAMTFAEYDLAFETCCPFNCREYLETMLSVPFRHRTWPDYTLHRELIRALWPDALVDSFGDDAPILKETVKRFLYRTYLYDMLKAAQIRFRLRRDLERRPRQHHPDPDPARSPGVAP